MEYVTNLIWFGFVKKMGYGYHEYPQNHLLPSFFDPCHSICPWLGKATLQNIAQAGCTDSQKAMTTPLGSLFFSDSALSSRSVLEFSQKWCWAANLQYVIFWLFWDDQNLDPQAQQKRPTN